MSIQIQPSIGKDPAIKDLSQNSIPGHAPTGYRPLRPGEKGGEVGKAAMSILNSSELGDQTPFEIDGQSYMGRTEPHYHPPPPLGEDPSKYPKPWGWHKGVTVFIATEGSPSLNYMPPQSSDSQARMKLLQRIQDSPENKEEAMEQILKELEQEL